MKNCAYCKRNYSDDNERCPECGRLLLNGALPSFIVSSSSDEGTSSGGFSGSVGHGNAGNQQTRNPLGGNQSDFEEAYPISNGNSFENNRHRTSNWPTIRAVMHYAIPAVLILIAVIMVIVYRETVLSILASAASGAVIGALIVFAFCLFFRRISGNVIGAGAIAGAVIAILVQYNLFGIRDGLSSLLEGVMTIVIMIAAIVLLIRIIFRRH